MRELSRASGAFACPLMRAGRGLRVLPKQRIGAKEYPDSLLACCIGMFLFVVPLFYGLILAFRSTNSTDYGGKTANTIFVEVPIIF